MHSTLSAAPNWQQLSLSPPLLPSLATAAKQQSGVQNPHVASAVRPGPHPAVRQSAAPQSTPALPAGTVTSLDLLKTLEPLVTPIIYSMYVAHHTLQFRSRCPPGSPPAGTVTSLDMLEMMLAALRLMAVSSLRPLISSGHITARAGACRGEGRAGREDGGRAVRKGGWGRGVRREAPNTAGSWLRARVSVGGCGISLVIWDTATTRPPRMRVCPGRSAVHVRSAKSRPGHRGAAARRLNRLRDRAHMLL